MSRDDAQFYFRMPQHVRDAIAEAAKKNNRSMTAEFVSRIEASLVSHDDELKAMLAELLDRVPEKQAAPVSRTRNYVGAVEMPELKLYWNPWTKAPNRDGQVLVRYCRHVTRGFLIVDAKKGVLLHLKPGDAWASLPSVDLPIDFSGE